MKINLKIKYKDCIIKKSGTLHLIAIKGIKRVLTFQKTIFANRKRKFILEKKFLILLNKSKKLITIKINFNYPEEIF